MGRATQHSSGETEVTYVAVDTGGTFTDLLILKAGQLRALKIPSTPDDPSRAVLSGVRKLIGERGTAHVLLHGTTVATNALLEGKGARVGLITNQGFEDVLEIGRQDRPQLYALVGHRAPPLVSREDRFGIAGRLDPEGAVVEGLHDGDLGALEGWAQGRDSIAVCLLHSYADNVHEEAVARALEGWTGPLSVSSRILPEFREFERTSTTVVNAFVAPLVSGYLARLEDGSDASRISIMGSAGGQIPVRRASEEPVHTVLSGPAGGVVGALDWAKRAGFENIITFDMGGTSTDVSLCPGEPLRTREFKIGSHPVAVPVLDIHTVGAGGGSLAHLDSGGALKVGPESAGAVPGPICYGNGGTGVTVTDAHVWLGRLPPSAFLGGEGRLELGGLDPAIQTLADAMSVTPEAAAEGVISVADSAMERALRVMSVERGYDPRDFCLVAFGGAGGLHVAELASRIGATSALVPPDPGLLSAYGILVAPVTKEVSRTVFFGSDSSWEDPMTEAFEALASRAVQALEADGHPPDSLTIQHMVDARYAGQSFELRVPAKGWIQAFHRSHEERYGYSRPDRTVEAVTVRVVAQAPPLEVEAPIVAERPEPSGTSVTVRTKDGPLEAILYQRPDLGRGFEITGPAIVAEYSGTTWVPEGWQATVGDHGSLRLTGELP
ncbi:MAG: hydantoinase/oxoprolinase family protein [Longimicrobiales bacterium]